MATGMETFPDDFALVKTTRAKFRVVQIRAVFQRFQLPRSAESSIFLSSVYARLLLQLWCMLSGFPHSRHLQTISMALTVVCRSVQVFLAFGRMVAQNRQSSTVLEECRTFYVDPFIDRHMYTKEIFSGQQALAHILISYRSYWIVANQYGFYGEGFVR